QSIGVRRAAAWIEARCGEWDRALAEVRRIFALEPGAGATALADIEPILPDGRIEEAIPPDPAAWRAWSIPLPGEGRAAEPDERLGGAVTRWPDALASRTVAATVAASRNDGSALARLVPPSLSLPERKENALLFAYRASTRGAAGDAEGARADARR